MPGSDIMVLTVNAAVQACRAFRDQYVFQQQFELLLNHLAEWIHDRLELIDSAYITVRDAGLLFVIVQKSTEYNQDLERALTQLDLEIANDSAYSLVRLDVLAIPHVTEDSARTFLAAEGTLRYKIDGK